MIVNDCKCTYILRVWFDMMVHNGTWWYMMVHDGTSWYIMVHDGTCISCQMVHLNIYQLLVFCQTKTPKRPPFRPMLLQQLPKLLGRVRVRGGHQIRRGLPGVKEEHIFHGHRLTTTGRMEGWEHESKYMWQICETYIKYVNIWRESTFNIQHMSNMKGVKGVGRLFDCCDGKPNHFGSCQSFEP